jgi:hypothetical protein
MASAELGPAGRGRPPFRTVLGALVAVISLVVGVSATAAHAQQAPLRIKAFPTGTPCWFGDTWLAPRGTDAKGTPRFHEGVDVITATGIPLYAVDDGRITRMNSSPRGGIQLYLTKDDGTYFFYAHLSRYADGLTVGQRVSAGTLVGYVGQTGDAMGSVPHLHFEIHPNGGAAINPYPIVKELDPCGTGTGRSTPPRDPLGSTPAGGSGFGGLSPLVPIRFADTRTAFNMTRFSPGTQNWMTVAGRGGVPADANAVAATVTVTNPASAGHVSVYPCGTGAPSTSTVNFQAGQTVANSVVVGLGTSGRLCFRASTATDVVLDITGFRGPSGRLGYAPVAPARLVDTRTTGGRLGAGGEVPVTVPGAGAQAATVNITAVNAGGPGFLTAYPCGSARPETSTLNVQRGQTVANGTTVGLGGGRLCVYSSVATDVVVDLAGTWQAGAGLRPTTVTPVRVLDTRTTGATLTPWAALRVPVAGVAGVPADAKAVVVNLTAVDANGPGFLTAYPCGGSVPATSSLNYAGPTAVANASTVSLGAGALCLVSQQAAHVIVDVTGYLR